MTIKWVNHPFGGALAYQANTPWRGVIHTTESPSLPSYSNGAVAPQITFDIKNRVAYKHYDYKNYAGKSLKHPSGTPVTNTTRCVQIEIIGYCDPAQSSSPLYIGKWTDADYAALNELLHEIEADVGIPHKFVPNWKAYPSSYGNNGVRMDNTDWAKFSGWCGHQHVPNNVHGDPGAINVSKLSAVVPEPPVTGQEDGMNIAGIVIADGTAARFLYDFVHLVWIKDADHLSRISGEYKKQHGKDIITTTLSSTAAIEQGRYGLLVGPGPDRVDNNHTWDFTKAKF